MGTEPKRRGRPAIEAAGRKSASLKFRTRGDLRARIDEAAAAAGMSSSEYVEQALEHHFLATDLRQIVREEIAVVLKAQSGLGLPEILDVYQSAAIPLRSYDHLPS